MKVKTKKAQVSEQKKKALEKFIELVRGSSTLLVASIEGISASQLQRTKRALAGQARITVVKKSLALRGLEALKKERPTIAGLKKWFEKPFALICSELGPFELSALLAEKRIPSKARAGQIAPADIVLEAGPTELPAGPAISELAALGIKTGLEAGKIAIKERHVLVKAGEPISAAAASVLSKLEIMPFTTGLEPLAAYTKGKVYEGIKIDRKATLDSLKSCSAQALALAVQLSYPTAETIKLLLIKASQQLNSLSRLIK